MRTQEEFDEVEADWRSRLKGSSLVVEANVDAAEAAKAFALLGQNFSRHEDREVRAKLLKQYQAALLLGLCTVGAREYDEGSFWPSVAKAFGQTSTQNLQGELSEAFRKGLASHGLSRFTTPLRNIGEILMHAGVPTPSLETYLRALLKLDSQNQDLDGRQFSAWARSMSRGAAAAAGLDAPTWRFMCEGGEIAEDFTDRCLALVDQFRLGSLESASDVSLPAHTTAEIERLLSSGVLDAARRRSGTQRNREENMVPRLVFSTTDGVQLGLPPLQAVSETDILWRISAEGIIREIGVPAPWPGDPIKPLRVALRPAKQVSVALTPGVQAWQLEFVDAEDPLLVFDGGTGEWVPPRNSLPKGPAWVLVPNPENASIEALLEVAGEVKSISEMEAPFGWEGWTVLQLDLTRASKLRRPGVDRWRYVSTITRPQLVLGSPIDHITTLDGAHVYASRPQIELPASEGASIEWIITVRRHGDEGTFLSASARSGDDQTLVDIWAETEDPLVGEFDIQVRGPLGRGLTARVVLAEGVSATASRTFRPMLTTGRGLELATVTIADASGATVVSMGPSQRYARHEFASPTAPLNVTVSLPHMTVTKHGTDLAPTTSILPQRFERESLARTHIRVAVPFDVQPVLVAWSGDQLLQSLHPGSTGRGYAQFNLAQLTDTLAVAQAATLTLAYAETGIPVGSVQPKALAKAVDVDPAGTLTVHTDVPIAGLAAAIYPDFAPWARPHEVRFDTGALSVQLPTEVLREGSGTVVLRVEDPWAVEPWPASRPKDPTNSFKVELGTLTDANDTESGFRRWLARTGECPVERDGLHTALTLYPMLSSVESSATYSILRRELAAAINANRAAIFDAALITTASSSDLMRAFVQADVVTLPVADYAVSPSIWSTSVLLGVLGGAHTFGTAEEAAHLDFLGRFVGPSALQILQKAEDPLAATGRFGDGVQVMNRWPQDRINEMWTRVSPVPGRTLDEDPRMIAAKALFDARADRGLRGPASSSQQFLTSAGALAFAVFGPAGMHPIAKRRAQDGWADLPAISIALALTARLAARGNSMAASFYNVHRDSYAELAHVAPAIVEQDLIIAELWITALRKLKKESWKP